jgi:hypothetical protein
MCSSIIKFSREKEAARSHKKWQEISKNRKLPRAGTRKKQETLTTGKKKKTGLQTEEEAEDPTFAGAERSSPAAGVEEGGCSGELPGEGGLERHRRRLALLVRRGQWTWRDEGEGERCRGDSGGEGGRRWMMSYIIGVENCVEIRRGGHLSLLWTPVPPSDTLLS